MRIFFILVTAILLAGCVSSGPKIGTIHMVTDNQGRLAKVFMAKSTGNAATDRRVLLFARSTFSARVPHPLPNRTYVHDVTGMASDHPGDITVRWH